MKCPSWPSLLERIKSLANPFEVQIFTKQVSCLLLLLPLRRAQVRWNTEHWTVYLSSKMHLVLHLRSHDLCTSTLLFLHPQISHFSSKKTLVTLDCKKACSSSSRITYSHMGWQIFFLQAPYLTCSVLWKISVQDGHTWASSLHPDSTLGENTPSCITLILNWKPKRHQFFLAKNQVQLYKDSPGAQ